MVSLVRDGSYLTELLIEKGYEVHGIVRRASLFNTDRIDHLYHDPHTSGAPMFLHYGDLTDPSSVRRILEEVQPDEFYNLGAQSHVKVSFEEPLYTSLVHRRRHAGGVGGDPGLTAADGKGNPLLPGRLIGNVRGQLRRHRTNRRRSIRDHPMR